jgi:tripartite-type tricarboxylate transporter receptor subunit TctC
MAGQIDVIFDPVATTTPAIASGHLRPIAVTNATRFSMLPNTPTLRELGFPGGEAQAYSGMLVPSATPADVVAKLNTAFNQALKRPDVRQSFERMNVQPIGGTPEAFGNLIRAETDRWVPLIRRLGLKAE